MEQVEAARCQVTDPVIGGRFVQHGTFATGPDTSDDLVLGVVVWRGRVFVHVEPGETRHTAAELGVRGVGQALSHDAAHAFTGMEPVGLRDEFAMVSAVLGELRLRRCGACLVLVSRWPSSPFL